MRYYLEVGFGRLAAFVFDHAKSFLVLMLAIFVRFTIHLFRHLHRRFLTC
jgi:hypothetical protein